MNIELLNLYTFMIGASSNIVTLMDYSRTDNVVKINFDVPHSHTQIRLEPKDESR